MGYNYKASLLFQTLSVIRMTVAVEENSSQRRKTRKKWKRLCAAIPVRSALKLRRLHDMDTSGQFLIGLLFNYFPKRDLFYGHVVDFNRKSAPFITEPGTYSMRNYQFFQELSKFFNRWIQISQYTEIKRHFFLKAIF